MNLAAEELLRLREGVRIDAVASLPADLRSRLESETAGEEELEAAFVLSRPGARAPIVQIDPYTRRLLAAFGDGASMASAVLRVARSQGLDAEDLLEASVPVIERLVSRGYLVAADAPPARLGYGAGDRVGPWLIVRTLSRMEDGEVHLVRRAERLPAGGSAGEGAGVRHLWGVLKISAPQRSFGRAEHEAEILAWLAQAGDEGAVGAEPVSPRLLEEGEEPGGHRWIVIEHCPGLALHAAAAGLRQRLAAGDERVELVRLCLAVVRAFAAVHRRDVVLGDVHSENVLVAGTESEHLGAGPKVWLVDFGCARRLDEPSGAETKRAGADFYWEPEAAEAILAGRAVPPASPAGEQFAVAALLYSAVTGRRYLDFDVDSARVMEQIVAGSPRSFRELAVPSWPELEAILGRALSQKAANRYASMDELAAALARLETAMETPPRGTQPGKKQPGKRQTGQSTPLQRASARTLARAGLGGPWLAKARAGGAIPSSLFAGAAGLAWSLLQAALRTGDPETLALADLWATRGLQLSAGEAPESPPGDQLPTAPLHGRAGPYEVAACVAWARADEGGFTRYVRGFLEASREETAPGGASAHELDLDLALGRPGSLLSALHLLRRAKALGATGLASELEELGNGRLAETWRRLGGHPKLAASDAWLGMAHGWGGALYATLLWCRGTGRPLPAAFRSRLGELIHMGVPHGRGMRWPWHRPPRPGETARGAESMAGWCHGSAGYVLLFSTLARRMEENGIDGDQTFDSLADAAAWDAWDRFVAAPDASSQLCCGLVGQAYSLLVRSRDTGDSRWRQRAEVMAQAAARRHLSGGGGRSQEPTFAGALFQGQGSLPALAADLETPAAAAWPWLEGLEELDGLDGLEAPSGVRES